MSKGKYPTVIVTVGTALINNLKRDEMFKDYVDSQDIMKTTAESSERINNLVSGLLRYDFSEKILGPEINSTYSLIEKGIITKDNIYLIVSETVEGKLEGKILKSFFEHEDNPIRFLRVEIKNIEGLQSKDEYRFKNKGLKNLVSTFAEIIRKHDKLVINATGGYKAEIAYATVIGQSFGKPVYYQFENFKNIIELPPQPVSLDFDFFNKHRTLLKKLKDNTLTDKEYDEIRKKFEDEAVILDGLVESVSERGERLYCLSAMGILYYEKCNYWLEKTGYEEPDRVSQKRKSPPRIDDPTAMRVRGLVNFVERLVKEDPFIITAYSIKANPDHPGYNRFYIKRDDLILEWSDGTATAWIVIKTSAETKKQLNWLVNYLNKEYFNRSA